MILSPQAHVTAPPSLAEVLAAAKDGSGLIGRLEVVEPTPTIEVPEDRAEDTHETLVTEAVETLTAVAEVEAAKADGRGVAERSAEVQRGLEALLPKLLAEIADLESCVRRANEEAERAVRHLDEARRLVSRVVAAAEVTPRESLLRLAVPDQRDVQPAVARPSGPAISDLAQAVRAQAVRVQAEPAQAEPAQTESSRAERPVADRAEPTRLVQAAPSSRRGRW